ncbi:hypothetical protein I3842_15G142100 [Carya illinoinensis]|uniref:TIR domain-containing protein n=1 Tax=Carya illinoinensis TaxID=32201 RepID=A0A922AGD6_CARIL|nr:hypothetical protein I3842_15G142100 [Carya illinoinensis]
MSSSITLPVILSPSSSYSSSLTSQRNYYVFLSFYGKYTRNSFTGHLNRALNQDGIKTYKDDMELRRGEEISPAFFETIEKSNISIVATSIHSFELDLIWPIKILILKLKISFHYYNFF